MTFSPAQRSPVQPSPPQPQPRPISAEAPHLSRRVDSLSLQLRDLLRQICEHEPIKVGLEARGFTFVAKPSRSSRARLPSLQKPPGYRDLADAVRDVPALVAYAPLLEKVARQSAKNSFDGIVSRLQFRSFLRQWRSDTAFCHRCGSGPFALNTSADDSDGAACAVCSTVLIAADRFGRDTRALVDFNAQIVRRRLACLEDKLEVLTVLRRAISASVHMQTVVAEAVAEVVSTAPPTAPTAQPLSPATGSVAAVSSASVDVKPPNVIHPASTTLSEIMARRSRSSERRIMAPRAQVRTASVPMRPLSFVHRGPAAQPLPALEMSSAVVGKRSLLHEQQQQQQQPLLRR